MKLITNGVRLDILSCIGLIDPNKASLEVKLLRGIIPWSIAGRGGQNRDQWVAHRDAFIRVINHALESSRLTAGLFHLGESRRGGNKIELVIFRGEDEEIWTW